MSIRRPLRRLILLGAAGAGIALVRNAMIERNRRRFGPPPLGER